MSISLGSGRAKVGAAAKFPEITLLVRETNYLPFALSAHCYERMGVFVFLGANWKFYKLKQKVWFWVCAYAILGALTALLAMMASRFIPNSEELDGYGADAVSAILSILASSMLAVTTFSLSIMVQAFSSASSSATPRSTSLLLGDSTTQLVLATFLGAFVYSLVGIVGLQSEIYGSAGRLVLFWVTMLVLVAVLWQLVRWINHLSNFGRLGDTVARVEAATLQAIDEHNRLPFLGGMPVPAGFDAPLIAEVRAQTTGYVEFVDVATINQLAQERGLSVHLCDLPGGFVHEKSKLFDVYGHGTVDDVTLDRLRDAVTIMAVRMFEQDPRFGLVTMAEIASRALSAGINDSGTAIDVFGRFVRIFSKYNPDHSVEPKFTHVFVGQLEVSDMMEDAFLTTIRDAAGLIEVHLRIQKTLLSLVELRPDYFAEQAVIYSDRSLAVAQQEMSLEADVERVRKLNSKIKVEADKYSASLSSGGMHNNLERNGAGEGI